MATPKGEPPLRLHGRCDVTNYGRGEILFVGQTSFSPGVWVGIALDESNGKHDGVVQGKRYFTVPPGHGIFVRTSQISVLEPGEEEEEVKGDGEEQYLEQEQESWQRAEEEKVTMSNRSISSRAPSQLSRTQTPQTPSSSSASPTKARNTPFAAPSTVTRPRTSGMPPPAGGSAAAARRALSPSKPSGVRSPTKVASSTPTSRLGPASSSAPMTRATSTASSGASGPARATSALGRTARTAVPSTPAQSASRPQPTSTVTSASSARPRSSLASASRTTRVVGSSKPTDPSTSRAGLRPVPHSRPSMAPNPRTSTGTATSAPVRRVAPASAARTSSSTVTPLNSSSSASRGQSGQTSTASARRENVYPSQRRISGLEDDEDLMTMDIEDDDPARHLALSDSDSNGGEQEQDRSLGSPSLRKSLMQQKDHMSLASGPVSASRNTPRSQAAEMAGMQREMEELRAKLRISDKKREEDREKMREMEAIKNEADQFMAVKPKLTERQTELQNEVKDLRKMERDWNSQKEELERQITELTDQIEMALLDKEVAEEKAEAAVAELESERGKVEELQIEMEVIKEEKAMYEDGGSGGEDGAEGELEVNKASPGYLQLEKQNERLKDALVRLRDLTVESDADQKRKISELEKELNSLSDLQQSYESVCGRLETSDSLLEDLKIQLDDALGAEEMLEQLTDKNLVLGEKVEEMRIVIEDLESLKELNDELEEAHVETEKQLQEEVDLKELQLKEHKVRHEALEANIVDYETTFSQFRELVLNLQNDLEQLRSQQAEAKDAAQEDGEGRDLASQSQAMLNLNMKLQSSNLKSQAKTIELELGKLDASQASSRLEMIQPYLPPAFFEADSDAVASLLFFRRMAHKADLIKAVVEGSHDIAGSLASVVPEPLISVCQMRHSLAHFAASSRQIAAVIQLAPVDIFLKAGRMYRELASVEKRMDMFIDALRKEELKEDECGKEMRRFVKSFEEFSFALGEEHDSDLAAKEVGSATLFDHDLDTLAAALGFAKQSVAALYNDEEIEWDLAGKSVEDDVFEPLQKLIDNIKAAKVPARKLLRRLASLYANDEAVKMNAIIALPGLGHLSSQLVTFAAQLAQSIGAYTALVRTSKTPLSMNHVVELIEDATREGIGKADINLWANALASTERLGQTIMELLVAATEQENVKKINGSSPWLLRVEQIKADVAQNVEAERQIAKLSEDAKDLFRQIKARDEALQEGGIKIERLQKQLEKSKEQSNQMADVRNNLNEYQRQAKAYQEGNEALQKELEELQRTNDQLVQQIRRGASSTAMLDENGEPKTDTNGGEMERGTSSSGFLVSNSSGLSSSLETSYLVDQVEALRGALRHLRSENSYLKSADLLGRLDNLPPISTFKSLSIDEENESNEGQDDKKIEAGLPVPAKKREIHDVSSAAAESRVLYKQLLRLASSPRLIMLPGATTLNLREKERGEGEKEIVVDKADDGQSQKQYTRRTWLPTAKMPESQLLAQKEARTRIHARVQQLTQSVRSLPPSHLTPLLV